MAQGYPDAQYIDDLSVEEKKLTESLLEEINNGFLPDGVKSDIVIDNNARLGYSSLGGTAKDNLDGIALTIKDLNGTVTQIEEICGCEADASLTISQNTYNFGRVILGNEATSPVFTVIGENLVSPIQFDVELPFIIEKSPDWDDYTGGTFTVTFSPTESGISTLAMNIYSTSISGENIMANVYLALSGFSNANAYITVSLPRIIFNETGEKLSFRINGVNLTQPITWTIPDNLVPLVTIEEGENWNNLTGGDLILTAIDVPDYQVFNNITFTSGDISSTVPIGTPGYEVISVVPDSEDNTYNFGQMATGSQAGIAFSAFVSQNAVAAGEQIFVTIIEGDTNDQFLVERLGNTPSIYSATVDFIPTKTGYSELNLLILVGTSREDEWLYSKNYKFTGTGI